MAEGGFKINADGQEVVAVADSARAELGRCVLTQESVAALVSQSPEDRYSALVTTTGLGMPDLTARAKNVLDDAKSAADTALTDAGLPPLQRRDSIAVKHLKESLSGEFARRLPSTHDLVGAEETLAEASAGAYEIRIWPSDDYVTAALIRTDSIIAELLDNPTAPGEVAKAFDEADAHIETLSGPRREAFGALRRLLDITSKSAPAAETPAVEDPNPAPLAQAVAIRWLAHANSLRDAATRFRSDAEAIPQATWAQRLREYADSLEATALTAPVSELEEFGRRPQTGGWPSTTAMVSDDVYSEAGFATPPNDLAAINSAAKELSAVLRVQIDALEGLRRDLKSHPARDFYRHADAVLGSLCEFELARQMRNAGPILNASEKLVNQLLQDRLAPVVRELVASIVRFEWYFKPLLVPEKGRKVVLGGLATSQADLDARLLLNSAERTALGIAWFLALHLLQPPERQEVLVLDDPTSVFDAPNQAGLISTLRAFVRLTQPKQLVVATHDELVASLLAEEFAPVDGWPSESVRLRCQRDSSDCSVVKSEPGLHKSRHIAVEAEQLGLGEAPAPH